MKARLVEWRRRRQAAVHSPFAATRRRLILTNLLVVAVLLALVGGAVYARDWQTVNAQLDQELQAYAGQESVGLADKIHDVEAQNNDHDLRYFPTSPNFFWVAISPQGRVLIDEAQVSQFGLPDVSAAHPVLDGRERAAYTTTTRDGYTFRLYTVPIMHDGARLGALQVGTSLGLVDEQLHELVETLGLISLAMLILTALTSVYFTDRALVPARKAYARQRQFAAAASHELRTPLALLRSQAELIAGVLSDSARAAREPRPDLTALAAQLDDLQADTADITADVDYLARMARDLLLLARDASDSHVLNWGVVNLRDIVAESVEKIRPLAVARGLSLTLKDISAPGAQHVACVRGDADRLRQLMFVLLDNAIHYTPRGGSVHVEIRDEARFAMLGGHARHLEVSVADTGIGIAPEHLAHIFEPFYRALGPHAPKENESGTGLGLALAQWIAQAHGGTITVKSVLDNGSVFTAHLPALPRRTVPHEG